ncbi:MAG: glycosyltransferase family 4 protein [candidate division KSB1 bacterium]|nr:glycosyltransferase family 4 protein [candidate division KSB1 bacterium]
MQRIKILHLLTLSDLGGAERMVLSLGSSLNRKHFNSAIACLQGGGLLESEAHRLGLPFFTLPSSIPAAFYRLVKLLRNEKIDLLQTHGARAEFLGACAGRVAGVKTISTLHDLYGFNNRYKVFLNRCCDPFIEHYVSVSEIGRRCAVERFGILPHRVQVIENGIELPIRVTQDRIDNLKRSLRIRDELLVVTVANLRPVKGHIHILRAVQSMSPEERRKFVFCFVGADQMNGELQRIAADMQVKDHIVFAGFQADISLYLGAADLFLLASEDEGLPLALLEAMAAACPVIACNVGGVAEVIQEGFNGLLIEPRSPQAIKEALLKLAAKAELRRMLGDKAAETAKARFSAENMVSKYAELYRRLVTA